jgi:RNA polymerase sigma factor (sigma-70 family)
MNIDALIKGCKEGQRKAQEGLYRNYYKTMMALCLRYTKNEADALDVLNRGFLKVFQQIHRYDPGVASPYTWIRTIVINSCLDFIKAKQRSEPWQEINEASEVHIAAEVITKMKTTELLQLVRQLPPATQAVFNLYVVEGYQHKEIATLLTISEGTSKWHLSEARKSLQKMMQAGKVNHL